MAAAMVVGDAEERERLQRLRLLGVDKDTTERYRNRRAWEYDVVSEGYRYHLTNIMASVGVSQIKRADEFIAVPASRLPRVQCRVRRSRLGAHTCIRFHRRFPVHL